MTAHTQHLEDPQRDMFAATGFIVIDGEPQQAMKCAACGQTPASCDCSANPLLVPFGGPLVAPEGWRILTEPCRCAALSGKAGWTLAPGFKQVKPCSDCVGGRRVVTLTATCPNCRGTGWEGDIADAWQCTGCQHGSGSTQNAKRSGKSMIGNFTIRELWPVVTETPDPFIPHAFVGEDGITRIWPADPPAFFAALDPLPQPGQFIARPEKVPE